MDYSRQESITPPRQLVRPGPGIGVATPQGTSQREHWAVMGLWRDLAGIQPSGLSPPPHPTLRGVVIVRAGRQTRWLAAGFLRPIVRHRRLPRLRRDLQRLGPGFDAVAPSAAERDLVNQAVDGYRRISVLRRAATQTIASCCPSERRAPAGIPARQTFLSGAGCTGSGTDWPFQSLESFKLWTLQPMTRSTVTSRPGTRRRVAVRVRPSNLSRPEGDHLH